MGRWCHTLLWASVAAGLFGCGSARQTGPTVDLASPVAISAAPAPGQAKSATFACRMVTDYSHCIVERLEGRASTESEILVLIQSHRALGDVDAVARNMRLYLSLFPDSPPASSYRLQIGPQARL